jgi:predicted nuclease of predicted toxin-antitoxin system
MKFLVDAQLPMKLAAMLTYRGYDVVHTSQLPHGNATTDGEINRITCMQQRILITKDRDFIESFIVQKKPYKLLYINVGNTPNKVLLELVAEHIEKIVELFGHHRFIELNATRMIVYG